MPSPPISSGVTMNTLKSRILNPALTSHYSVLIYPPQIAEEGEQTLAAYLNSEFGLVYDLELMELTCTEASLPGSSLATIETLDYMGVTEKHAYRRLYDDTIDFTFLVTQDSNYQQIRFFDGWIRYIVREESSRLNQNVFYARARYPSEYKGTLQIAKFEKNLGSTFNGNGSIPLLIYNFVDAYPKSINSVPITYDSSELLKVTVSFTYSRYFVDKQISNSTTGTVPNPNSPGVPENNRTVTSESNGRSSWRYSAAELDRVRGATALASLAGSPLGQRILDGSARSTTANSIADQSFGRVLQ